MLPVMNIVKLRNLVACLLIGLGTVNGRCSFLEHAHNSPVYRSSRCYFPDMHADSLRDTIGDLICDLIKETLEIKQTVENQGWSQYHGDCHIIRPSEQGSANQNVRSAFVNVSRLMPFMEVLSNVTEETDGISFNNLTGRWCMLLRYLSTFMRNQGISRSGVSVPRAQVNINMLRENYASRIHLRYVLMSDAQESLTQLRDALQTTCVG